MIQYQQITLANGLNVVASRDRQSKLAAVNLVYKVGSRNENPNRTGFAHLFEHLMFRGTRTVPDFDTPVQMAAGENNAFTTPDYTDFYITLPAANISTALWLESNRMEGLDISEEKLEAEKKVVIEEFKQRYLNQPYGDQTMLLRALAYKVHPYRWATIGLKPEHIAQASLDEVRTFYQQHYRPGNAILSLCADLDEQQMFDLAEQWFGSLKDTPCIESELPQEPEQTEPRREQVTRDVPATAITLAWHMCGRTCPDFYLGDLTSDLLAGGDSSRLYRRLVQERKLFASVNCYTTCDQDPGLFVLSAQLLPSTSVEQAEQALWEEIHTLRQQPAPAREIEKIQNKFEAATLFGELNVMNKAMNMGFYAMLGNLELINGETALYRAITSADVQRFAMNTLTENRCNTLIYSAK